MNSRNFDTSIMSLPVNLMLCASVRSTIDRTSTPLRAVRKSDGSAPRKEYERARDRQTELRRVIEAWEAERETRERPAALA